MALTTALEPPTLLSTNVVPPVLGMTVLVPLFPVPSSLLFPHAVTAKQEANNETTTIFFEMAKVSPFGKRGRHLNDLIW
jgi:hypothetical protein